MTSFGGKTVIIKIQIWVPPSGIKPYACNAEAIVMSYHDENLLLLSLTLERWYYFPKRQRWTWRFATGYENKVFTYIILLLLLKK